MDPDRGTRERRPRLVATAARADNIVLVIAGGGYPTNAYRLPECCPRVIRRTIDMPANFDQLLADAERNFNRGADAAH